MLCAFYLKKSSVSFNLGYLFFSLSPWTSVAVNVLLWIPEQRCIEEFLLRGKKDECNIRRHEVGQVPRLIFSVDCDLP